MHRMNLAAVSQLVAMILCMTVAQLLFKKAGTYANLHQNWLHALVLNPWLWCGFLVSGIGMFFWLRTLRKVPLSIAYPWTALIYVMTPIASTVCFGEVLSSHYLGGMSLIVAGVFLSAGGEA